MYGGLGRHTHALAESLAAADHEVTVVTQHAPGAAYDEVVNGVRVVRVSADPPLVPRADLLAWVLSLNHSLGRVAAQIATQSGFDVVHAHDWVVAHAAAAVKSAAGLPLVATMHATEAGRHQGWLPGALSKAIHTTEWWLTFEARRVITCSSHMRWEVTRLFDLPPPSVDVVPNGIHLDTWHVPEQQAIDARDRWAAADAPFIAYTGRLEYEKGVHTLLRALPRLRRRFPGLRLVVAGTGTHEAELRALARSLRLGRAVTFTGFLDQDVLAVLAAAADVAVVPSRWRPRPQAHLLSWPTPVVCASSSSMASPGCASSPVTSAHWPLRSRRSCRTRCSRDDSSAMRAMSSPATMRGRRLRHGLLPSMPVQFAKSEHCRQARPVRCASSSATATCSPENPVRSTGE